MLSNLNFLYSKTYHILYSIQYTVYHMRYTVLYRIRRYFLEFRMISVAI